MLTGLRGRQGHLVNSQSGKSREGYSMITPNMSRRSQLQQLANKELEELKQWKETHRPGPINVTPTQLGGFTSEAEARRRQQINQCGSKFQQRAKKEEYDRKRKEAEELENQKKKEIQREKANKLAEKRRQEDEQRRAQHHAHHYQANQQFLQRMDTNRSYSPSPLPPNYSVATTSWARSQNYRETQKNAEEQRLQEWKEEQRKKGDLLTEKESQLEAEKHKWLKEEHRRKNNAFLDNLERRRQCDENSQHFGPPSSDERSFEYDTKQYSAAPTFYEDLEEDEQDSVEDAIRGSPEDPCSQWDMMKLQSCFPDYEVTVLEDLLRQCNGDFNRLTQLLQ
uniref:epithelial-stromal interaction protein 1 isoform X2 n=1 Tax=Pristiophorus japonicus TaxID=55135 RepID=UPI00398E77F2